MGGAKHEYSGRKGLKYTTGSHILIVSVYMGKGLGTYRILLLSECLLIISLPGMAMRMFC